jgi:hypothetical protein
MKRLLCVVVLLASVPAFAADRNRNALKTLRRLQRVDGAGSGLDADTVRGLKPLVVLDANDAFVGAPIGPPMDTTGATYVARRIGDRPFLFYVTRDGFTQGYLPRSRFFPTADCSGTAYLEVRAATSMLPDDVLVHAATAYYPDMESVANRTMLAVAKFAAGPDACFNGAGVPPGVFVPPDTCCDALPSPREMPTAAARTLDLGTLGLVPPFRFDVP